MSAYIAGEAFGFTRPQRVVDSPGEWRDLDCAVWRWVMAHGGDEATARAAAWASHAEGQGHSALPLAYCDSSGRRASADRCQTRVAAHAGWAEPGGVCTRCAPPSCAPAAPGRGLRRRSAAAPRTPVRRPVRGAGSALVSPMGSVTLSRVESNASIAAHWGSWRLITGSTSYLVLAKPSNDKLCLLGDQNPSILPTLERVAQSAAVQDQQNACYVRR